MNTTMALVTVYFVGLVNIYNGNEVIVPRATSEIPRGDVMLHAHTTAIYIKGLAGDEEGCASLLGEWKDERCEVLIAGGTTVTLPPSAARRRRAPRRNSSAASVPKLGALCPNISGIKTEYLTDPLKYALRMTITSGTWNACTNDKQWISYLTTDPGSLKIKFPFDEVSATLNDDAVVWIVHQPIGEAGADPKPHFWWYYEMYNVSGNDPCMETPDNPMQTIACPTNFSLLRHASHGDLVGASGDVGCSNSNYP